MGFSFSLSGLGNGLKNTLGLGSTDTSQMNQYLRTPEQKKAEADLLNQLIAQSKGQANPASDMALNQGLAIGAAQSHQSSNPFLGIKAAQIANQQGQAAAQLGAQQQLGNLISSQRDAALGAAANQQNAQAADQARRTQFVGNLAGAGATLFAPKFAPGSDKNMKENIKPEKDSGKKIDEFLSKLDPYTFEYIDKKEGNGERMGIMAQDLEKSPIGAAAVAEDENGNKRVDPSRLAMPILAAQSEMIKRIKELEDKVKKRA